jgi:hypothetical protein
MKKRKITVELCGRQFHHAVLRSVPCVTETSLSACPFGLFLENIGDLSEGHGGRFHQYISQSEKRYSRKKSRHMLADCYWSLIRETPSGRQKEKWVLNEFFIVRIPYIETLFVI